MLLWWKRSEVKGGVRFSSYPFYLAPLHVFLPLAGVFGDYVFRWLGGTAWGWRDCRETDEHTCGESTVAGCNTTLMLPILIFSFTPPFLPLLFPYPLCCAALYQGERCFTLCRTARCFTKTCVGKRNEPFCSENLCSASFSPFFPSLQSPPSNSGAVSWAVGECFHSL